MEFVSLFVVCAAVLVCFIALWRNELIFKYRTRALREIYIKSIIAIDNGDSPWKYYEKYDSYGSYDQMFADITKWRYNQFFPDI